MATPYLQIKLDEVPSTQDVARSKLDVLPVAVIAAGQSRGRGRSGSTWNTAPRAVAVSAAIKIDDVDGRPFSLMAGLAACRSLGDQVRLKWPNDVLVGGRKVGGILVEMSNGALVVGCGLNLWWPDSPDGVGALFDRDPGAEAVYETGALWAAEMFGLIEGDGWPLDEYSGLCETLGRQVTWEAVSVEQQGSGKAVGVDDDGGLIVELDGETTVIRSGAVKHVR
jgi:BirA family biotin operon repressor/biotin-[acetyl-CoA-carboxylase] ligase